MAPHVQSKTETHQQRLKVIRNLRKFTDRFGFAPPVADADGFERLYFLQADHTDGRREIKIGRAWDVANRYFDLEFACPGRLQYLSSVLEVEFMDWLSPGWPHTLDASPHAELVVKNVFAPEKIHGEWYRPTGQLLALTKYVAETFHPGLPPGDWETV